MTVAVQQSQRQKKDPLETLAQGLGIARSVFGIKADMAALEDHTTKRQEADEMKARMSRGELTPAEDLAMTKDYDRSTSNPGPGALQRSVADQNGNLSPVWYSTKKQAGKTFEQEKELAQIAHPSKESITPYQQAQLNLESKKLELASGKAGVEKEPKPNQYQAATFGRRLEAAENVFDNLATEGYDRTSKTQGILSAAPGFMQPGQLKQQEQAERNFINAQLRRESGSAISDGEFASAEQQYFPRVGDTPEVLAQKSQNRAIARQGLMKEAGKAWDEIGQIALVPAKKKESTSGTAIADPKSTPKQVIQNGHTYILNEKTGKYE